MTVLRNSRRCRAAHGHGGQLSQSKGPRGVTSMLASDWGQPGSTLRQPSARVKLPGSRHRRRVIVDGQPRQPFEFEAVRRREIGERQQLVAHRGRRFRGDIKPARVVAEHWVGDIHQQPGSAAFIRWHGVACHRTCAALGR